jgi:hypothetical protein
MAKRGGAVKKVTVGLSASVAAVAAGSAKRAAAARMSELDRVSAATGLPAAQRGADAVTLQKVVQIGDEPRVADKTVRKLTRVERLRRAGVLEHHEAAACEWYADQHALAWDTQLATASYEGGGSGGGGRHAPDRLMARTIAVQRARDDILDAVRGIPATWLAIFENVVCRNEAIGPVATDAFADLARTAAEGRTRTVIKMIACKIGERVPGLPMTPEEASARTALVKTDLVGPAQSAPTSTLVELIDAQIALRDAIFHPVDALWMGEAVHDALALELGSRDGTVERYRNVEVIVKEGWGWAWLIPASGALDEAA